MKGIENLRILTETTMDDFPIHSIEHFAFEAVEEYDKLKERNKQLVHCFNALVSLVDLKNYKDEYGKDMTYIEHQPKVWALAREALEQVK